MARVWMLPGWVLATMAGTVWSATPKRDWPFTLRTDARAFHDIIAANHPGPVNLADPSFARRNDAGPTLALRRAAQVRDYAGYYWALSAYEASFDDGHVAIETTGSAPVLPVRWPGFLTGIDGRGRAVVMSRADDASVPLGAELQSCDGVPAERLAAQRLGAFWGRWMLASQRIAAGGRLLLDQHNPFLPTLRRCRFGVAGRARDVTLAWRRLPAAELRSRLAATAPRAHPPISARTLADGTRWFTFSSFDSDPDAPAVKALVPLIAGMARDREAIAGARRVVFDLRGNNGGSSDWSRQVAVILWGQAAVARFDYGAEAVDWRVSTANLATIEEYRHRWAGSADISRESKEWADRTATGLAAARAAGQPLWRTIDPPEPPASPSEPVPPPSAKVYVLTDRGCGSACLDAVDLWRALGAVQVGQETAADSLYMEVRSDALPSGLAIAHVPMKVYRGRRRGSNVPWTPDFRYAGDMRDTAALERWLTNL